MKKGAPANSGILQIVEDRQHSHDEGFGMNTKRIAQLVLGIFLGAAACGNSWAQKAEGLGSTPPMGWNSWNKLACDIDERLIRETADAMVKQGLKVAGYQ
jgi:alpha-galactosidase